jgi:hypothetical protein
MAEKKPSVPVAYMWASGHVAIATKGDLPPAALPLMAGELDKLKMILEGNAEPLTTPDGSPAWSVETVMAATVPAERYVAAMLWLAKVARLYSDTKVVFYVNKATNRDVRRATAQVINKTLN